MPSNLEHSAAVKPTAWLIGGCLLAVYIVWGTTYFAIKVAIEGFAPFFLVGTRFTVAGVLLLGWQALRGAPAPTAKQWGGAAVVGFLLLVVGNGAVSIAEHWVSSGATVALISVMPLATALWSGAFGHWPRRAEWSAIALGGAGAAIMLLGRDLQGSMLGTSLILFGTISWSLGTVLSRRLDIPHGPTGFGAEMLTAGLMGLCISAALGEHWTIPSCCACLVGMGIPGDIRILGRVFGVSVRGRARIGVACRNLCLCQSSCGAHCRLVAGQRNVFRQCSCRLAHCAGRGGVARLDPDRSPLAPVKVPLDTARCLPSQARGKP